MNENIYRVVVLGVKGGVGKSTVAISLAKELALKGKNVLIVDRDLLGTASQIFGIQDKGLLTKIVLGEQDLEKDLKKIQLKGTLACLKLFGDGDRTYEDLEMLHKYPELRQKLSSLYKQFITEENYDYIIFDNPPGITTTDDIARHEIEIFYSVYPKAKSVRIYVSNSSTNVITSTVEYMNKIESGISSGIPFAFIINMVPAVEESIKEAKEKLERILANTKVNRGVVIPLYSSLFNYTGNVLQFPQINEIKDLVESLVKGTLEEGKKVVAYISYQSILEIIKPGKTILLYGRPGTGKAYLIYNTLKYIAEEMKEKKIEISLAITNEKILSMVNNDNIKGGVVISTSNIPSEYKEERLFLTNIGDVLKFARKLADYILSRISDSTRAIILYRTNDVTPQSNCCDLSLQKYEFWNALIAALKYKGKTTLILVCDDVNDECNELLHRVDYVVKTSEEGYQIKEVV